MSTCVYLCMHIYIYIYVGRCIMHHGILTMTVLLLIWIRAMSAGRAHDICIYIYIERERERYGRTRRNDPPFWHADRSSELNMLQCAHRSWLQT